MDSATASGAVGPGSIPGGGTIYVESFVLDVLLSRLHAGYGIDYFHR